MNTKRKIQSALLAGVMAASFAVPAMASPMMQPVHEGDATFITGGIGADEQQALEASAKNYNLEITNANKAGDFTADTNFQITSKNGREMISATNTGPLFYAKLPAGEYTIRATNGDQQIMRHVKVSTNRPEDMHLIWKQG
jgi:hypothetical protein